MRKKSRKKEECLTFNKLVRIFLIVVVGVLALVGLLTILQCSLIKTTQASKANLNANNFVGTGYEWCMEHGYGSEYLCDYFYGTFANDKVVMKWNDEWNRGEEEHWMNPPYDNAWVVEQWNGNVKDGSGYTQQWKYKWDEGCASTHQPSMKGGTCWHSTPFVILMYKTKEPGSPYIWWMWKYEDGKWYKHAAPGGLGN